MDFAETRGIFQQIADNICDKILQGEFKENEKIPSVRQQAAITGVNQNTIMRTYMELQRDEIITNRRGIGYFVAPGARKNILEHRKENFFNEILPGFIEKVKLLNLDREDLKPLLDYLNQKS
ncbi:GntR family transcriptional regulator [Marinilabilia rubra]|uniref:GntR family transcriptional regulator n=1 Tax=Marinilabilia rubra TaxID=2162893 RepID=A0A2U2BBM9_9BACT|nr:GntR family transcriptional regulator [Marinilabilia rubra]PWE00437.1 GntR family transcriptional regulator [Marinilabilia rubra]